jgi:hypothetical protein
MLIRSVPAHIAACALVVIALAGRIGAAQEPSNAGELAASMESAQRCLATRDTIAAANDIRSCSAYALAMANRSQGHAQTTLLSASYALDSLADRIEMGRGATTPAATHSAFARTQYALAEAHADAAREQWATLAAAPAGHELRLSTQALAASLAERNRRADRATAARIRHVVAVADALERGSGYTAPDVLRAFVALREALVATRP